MSYNTRRNTPNYGTPQHQQSSSVGQRRPAVTNNFVSGGQLSGSQQQKPQGQQTPQRSQQQQQQYRNQTPQASQQQNYQSQNYSGNQQQARYQQGQQTPTVKVEPKASQQQPPKPPVTSTPAQPAPVAESHFDEKNESMDVGGDQSPKKRWFQNKGRVHKLQNYKPQYFWISPPSFVRWLKSLTFRQSFNQQTDDAGEIQKYCALKNHPGNYGKISKAEKVRRRNLKLSKILQPKNAVMILNELVKGCVYNVDEIAIRADGNQFRGTVTFDGQEFAGTGRTKIGAKNSAAETALKHLVKHKQLGTAKKDDDGDEKMEISDEDGSQVMPWSHIASFAMYKLFSTWGEDPNLVNKVNAQDISSAAAANKAANQGPPKPAKKMPENPETLNPIMLMHQMLPHAVWEEAGKSGNPPDVVFTLNVCIDNQKFTGTGPSKKIAKRMAAFAACHDILKVTYPPDVWSPSFNSA